MYIGCIYSFLDNPINITSFEITERNVLPLVLVSVFSIVYKRHVQHSFNKVIV